MSERGDLRNQQRRGNKGNHVGDGQGVGDNIYVITHDRCTECVGHFDEPQCAAVCPVDNCCIADPPIRKRRMCCWKRRRRSIQIRQSMPPKCGAACAINHRSSFNEEGPASHMRCRAFLLLAGYSKRPSSKAAASEDARRTLRYVELLSEARTPLADFFSILLKKHRPLRNIAKRAMITHLCQERLLDHQNLAADMARM